MEEGGHDVEGVVLLDQVFGDGRDREHLDAKVGDRDVSLLVVPNKRVHNTPVLSHIKLEKNRTLI